MLELELHSCQVEEWIVIINTYHEREYEYYSLIFVNFLSWLQKARLSLNSRLIRVTCRLSKQLKIGISVFSCTACPVVAHMKYSNFI